MIDSATTLLPPDSAADAPEHGASPLRPGDHVELLGAVGLAFEEQFDGLREPAHAVRHLRAELLAWGAGRSERLALAVDGLTASASPPAQPLRPPPWSKKLPPQVWVDQRTTPKGMRCTIRVGPAVARRLVLLAGYALVLGYLALLFGWHGWHGVGAYVPAVVSLATLAIVCLLLLGRLRSMTIRADGEELSILERRLPDPRLRRWRCAPVTIAEVYAGHPDALLLRLADGSERSLLVHYDGRQRAFVGDALRWILRAKPWRAPSAPIPTVKAKPSRSGGQWTWGWYLVPPALILTLVFVPGFPVTHFLVWRAARQAAESCPEVTRLLGNDISWAMGPNDGHHTDHHWVTLTVRGDRERAKMYIRWNRKSGALRLVRLDVTVGRTKVCALHCRAYYRKQGRLTCPGLKKAGSARGR